MNRLSSIRAVILDWAGTTVDHGSVAPAMAFVELFRQRGIEITLAEARGPMGKSKRDHIATILAMPRVATRWQDRYHLTPTEVDVHEMYLEFTPLQKQILIEHSGVIPGVVDAVQDLRNRGIKIGSSTGFSRELIDIVIPHAAKYGYAPDAVITADDVPAGRPAPWMNFAVARLLGVYPMQSILVVDDTPIGIQAGVNAGAVTVAVTRTGNELGLSEQDTANLSTMELASRLKAIKHMFLDAGATYVVESVADIPSLFGRHG